jgi:hypothetical protein
MLLHIVRAFANLVVTTRRPEWEKKGRVLASVVLLVTTTCSSRLVQSAVRCSYRCRRRTFLPLPSIYVLWLVVFFVCFSQCIWVPATQGIWVPLGCHDPLDLAMPWVFYHNVPDNVAPRPCVCEINGTVSSFGGTTLVLEVQTYKWNHTVSFVSDLHQRPTH